MTDLYPFQQSPDGYQHPTLDGMRMLVSIAQDRQDRLNPRFTNTSNDELLVTLQNAKRNLPTHVSSGAISQTLMDQIVAEIEAEVDARRLTPTP